MSDTISGWKLRREFGDSVSFKQLNDFQAWGLLPEPEDGRFPLAAVKRVERILELGKEVRPLCRRVILLQFESQDFRIPAAAIRKAMVAMVPGITAPKRKMARVNKTMEWIFTQWGRPHQDARIRGGAGRYTQSGMPVPQEWIRILQDPGIDLDLFHLKEAFAGRWAREVIPLYTDSPQGKPYDLEWILLEERIVLLTVRDLHLTLEGRQAQGRIEQELKMSP